MKGHVVVVGAGVVGLTTALQLLLDGIPASQITVVAKDLSADTVSCVAGALWESPPYQMEANPTAVQWCATTLHILTQLSRDHPDAGIHIVPSFTTSGTLLETNVDAKNACTSYIEWETPAAANALLRRAGVPELGDKFRYFQSYDAPVAAMDVYLDWLNAELRRRGVVVRQAEVTDLWARAGPNTVVVNCTGLAAHAYDSNVYPCKGQVVRVHAPWVRAAILDMDSGAYMIPRPNGDLICGGTSENDVWDLTVESHVTEAILRKCTAVLPSIANARVLGVRTGHRPNRRGGVRLEAEASAHGGYVVHNYGHGGSGLCCSWGTAIDASKLVRTSLARMGHGAPRSKL
ncbi:amino acid oxidase [Achlya hypogyna]|uniref:Amino acid oxidase n=1 Tax=Achlya hypogyna TaxID=1202772 RepID=A0A0A7CLU5_ACHHY|nr:secreted protein [Achlya hypogyna]OQR93668.1 amino acid oxidase [Achlya hypogyna]